MKTTLKRIAAGDYETSDGRFRIYRHINVSPPAWSVVECPWSWAEETWVDGAASLRDARLILEELLDARGSVR